MYSSTYELQLITSILDEIEPGFSFAISVSPSAPLFAFNMSRKQCWLQARLVSIASHYSYLLLSVPIVTGHFVTGHSSGRKKQVKTSPDTPFRACLAFFRRAISHTPVSRRVSCPAILLRNVILSSRHKAEQTKPRQQHGISFRFWNNSHGDHLSTVIDIHCLD